MRGRDHRRVSLALAAGFALALTACVDEGTGRYSETLSLRLSGIQEQDIANDGGYSQEKNVNTETGNPYADFLRNARDQLGTDPSSIQVRAATVRLDADTTGATTLDQVFESMELFLGDNDTRVGVGSAGALGGTEASIGVPSDQSALAPIQSEMLAGSFNVGVRGTAADGRPGDFDVRLVIDIQFEAIP